MTLPTAESMAVFGGGAVFGRLRQLLTESSGFLQRDLI